MASKRVTRVGLAAVWFLSLLGAAGCGPAIAPVEGVVTLNEAPLPKANVLMSLEGAKPSDQLYLGETDSEGKYRLRKEGRETPGATPGFYKVQISTVKVPPGADERTPLPEERVPRKYRDGSVRLEVPPGGLTNADFHIITK